MAEDPAPGKASAISGWTAFSNPAFVKSALADLQATTAPTGQSSTDTPVADVADATTPISQSNNNDDDDGLFDAFPSDSEPTQEEKDYLLIADPPRLSGEALINLVKRLSTADIVELSNEATGGNLTRVAINGRLNAALNKKAKALDTTKAKLKEELTEFRKARGIRSTRRRPDHRHSVVGGDAEIGGDEASESGQAEGPEGDGVKGNIQVKSAPQADATAIIQQSKGEDLSEEKSDADTEDDAEDDAALAAQQQADHEAFQDQNSLKGEKILLLAERYSNADISARICGILGNYPLTENGVATRIHVALEKRANATGVTTDQVRDDLNAARLASGAVKVTPRGRGIMRVPKGSKTLKAVRKSKHSAVTGTLVVAKEGAKMTDVLKQSVGDEGEMEPPRKRAKKTHDSVTPVATPVAVEVDAGMTDDDSAVSRQDGYGADEVEGANTLLEIAAGGPEVREAATILVNMHKGGVQPEGGQPEQSGETARDMNDSGIYDV
jgi:hypothetical protein